MRNLKDIILEKLKVTKDLIYKTEDIKELVDARQLIFEPSKKDTCSVKFDCPNLLNKYLNKKIKSKLNDKSLGNPITLKMCYSFDKIRDYYSIAFHILNERNDICLYATSEWEYGKKNTSVTNSMDIFEYMLKNENCFEEILKIFNTSRLKYNNEYNWIEAQLYSIRTLLINLKKLI